MLNTHPFRVRILFRSGKVETFTTKSLTTGEVGNDLVRIEWKESRPKKLYTRLDEVVSITSERRFPWGLFA